VVYAEDVAGAFAAGASQGVVGGTARPLPHQNVMKGRGMLISVRVIPRSRKNSVEWDGEGEGGRLKVRLTASPVDGAANEALVALLAERLGVPKRQVVIVRGATSRLKVVEVAGLNPVDLRLRLA